MAPLPTEDLPDSARPLYDRGNVYVTLAAAQDYAAHRRIPPEDARRELTWLLLDARLVSEAEGGRPAKYRRRSRSSGVDVTAHVVDDPQHEGLAVVVAVHVRPMNAGRR